MPEPQWSNAQIPKGFPRDWLKTHDSYTAPMPEVHKIHVLSSYSDDIDGLKSSKTEDPIELPVLSPNGPVNEKYKVALSTFLHEEFQTNYMIKDDPLHYERRYVVWLGIDLDRFGLIDTPASFFRVLEMSLLSEHIIIQEGTPPVGLSMPKRALWMVMHGYFGNWYEPEGKKWAVLAAKRRTRLLKKLWERGDIRLVDEKPLLSEYQVRRVASTTRSEVETYREFLRYQHFNMGKEMIFPELWEEEEEDKYLIIASVAA
ncbi:uncharacterized protein N7518_004769 [Penicillium psychrosexuale]|uniref:uncharacterized protein n=1 Tax=Penicillium psychrosexuale TaxID=1002107 RepID=UPI00254566AF|nr:uncharacterized protein N7518_004769 [Penicillium psychrosexuale]KAJ5796229.1 hypothetical protein N7518_004769 [Penicillium psychrosexuale]